MGLKEWEDEQGVSGVKWQADKVSINSYSTPAQRESRGDWQLSRKPEL